MLDFDCFSHRKCMVVDVDGDDHNKNHQQDQQQPYARMDHNQNAIINKSVVDEDPRRSSLLATRVKMYDSGANPPFFSVEFFPPRTEKVATSFYRMVEKFSDGQPFFTDITWQVAGNPGSMRPTSSLTTADYLLNYSCMDTMLHITCIGLKKADLRRYLDRAKCCGITNILALRGDKNDCQDGEDICDFKYACDLIQFIREEYGQYFTIVVAGYPVPHPEARSMEHDLQCLKHKVDAGADFIITQMFFECEEYFRFVRHCRQIGINVPIIPGICSIKSYESLIKLCELSKLSLPERLLKRLEPIKDNLEAVRLFGVDYLTELCRNLMKSRLSPGLHFYTLNDDTIIRVIKNLGLWKKLDLIRIMAPQLPPWKKARMNPRRTEESVRPVHWANRPKSYIYRTKHWQEFPTIQWSFWRHSKNLKPNLYNNDNGDDDDGGFPEFVDGQVINLHTRNFLTKCNSLSDLYELFHQYYAQYFDILDNNNAAATGDDDDDDIGRQLFQLPWFPRPNTGVMGQIFAKYGQFIEQGLLIVNYLPSILSYSPAAGGINKLGAQDYQVDADTDVIYHQKEYIEFFLEAKHLDKIISLLKAFDGEISFKFSMANQLCDDVDEEGKSLTTNVISWTSPSRDNLQCSKPIYISDQWTFDLWRQEAFGLFDKLIATSIKNNDILPNLRETFRRNFVLVSMIDNGQQTMSTTDRMITFQKIFDQIFFSETNNQTTNKQNYIESSQNQCMINERFG